MTPATKNAVKQIMDNGGGYVSAKVVAGILRSKLKECFPGLKFSVKRGSSYSSVDVRIVGGKLKSDDPTEVVSKSDVDHVVKQYQGGGFDGMTDYAYNHQHWMFDDGSALMRYNGSPYATDKEEQHAWASDAGAVPVSFASNYIFVNDDRKDNR